MITLIVAMDKNRVIGKNGEIPWYLPADFAHFKEVTTGHPIIMGLNTHKSIGRLLPNRANIVLSDNGENFEGALMASSLEEAFAIAKKTDTDIFVIGGANVYAQTLSLADRLDIAWVDAKIDNGDIFFPEFNKKKEWIEKSRVEKKADEYNQYNISWVVYERKKKL
ncbi:dihydrofolate reductase [Patescibacteria group bacterium]|nr:dihydrofolate reductase [Patescibacteria group bacterium]MBU1246520.1 dihydrofolate reductase [Patescibacteria group bacterium]MBU1519314.1 dihydrofolate reductase [Patescibacteria group bacterium]MBU1730390.1 dihydrofolate reductase [Patescibacteria group bacterium]MBU1956471.1 dihydrofolate reductase [Patescibacteria group bacterium]